MFTVGNKIEFSFFTKPISSPFVILYKSAVSNTTKRNSLFQEGLRRFRDMSNGVSEEEKRFILSKFMNTLKESGYDLKYRYTLLQE